MSCLIQAQDFATWQKNQTTNKKRMSLSDKQFDPSRLTYGGNFGLTFASVTYVDISPMVGYRVTDRLTPGVGITYTYYREKYNNLVYQTSFYGGRVFTRYNLFPNIFVHGELEFLNFDHYDFLTAESERIWFTSPIIGAGYMQPAGQRAAFMIYVLYALRSEELNSPYNGNPLIFRLGFFI